MEVTFIPKFLVRRLSGDTLQQLNLNALMSSILLMLLPFLVPLDLINSIPHICLFDKITGFPCPACGILRSIMSLYRFDVSESIHYNPSGILVVTFFMIQTLLRIQALCTKEKLKFVTRLSKKLSYYLVSILLLSWIFHIINLNF